MKKHITLALALTTAAFAQGPLNPTAAPAPTMKTLTQISDQITPIRADASVGITASFNIVAAGHYYLKNNVSVGGGAGINIDADNVTLDLNGFTISSTGSPANGSGVAINGVRKNIRIRNGFISGATTLAGGVFTPGGFNNGIFSASASSRSIVITDIHVGGVANTGIGLAGADVPGTIVDRCTVGIAKNYGIVAHTVSAASVEDCGGRAIWATNVGDSTGSTFGGQPDHDGIFADNVSNSRGIASSGGGIKSTGSVINSRGTSNTGAGISGGNIFNCIGTSGIGDGIDASDSVPGSVANSTGTSTDGIGITANGSTSNSTGTSLTSTGIFVSGDVSNSTGRSNGGIGIHVTGNATNCSGHSVSGSFGMNVGGTASFCIGARRFGTAINASIAIGCTVFSGAGVIVAPEKHLGTP